MGIVHLGNCERARIGAAELGFAAVVTLERTNVMDPILVRPFVCFGAFLTIPDAEAAARSVYASLEGIGTRGIIRVSTTADGSVTWAGRVGAA